MQGFYFYKNTYSRLPHIIYGTNFLITFYARKTSFSHLFHILSFDLTKSHSLLKFLQFDKSNNLKHILFPIYITHLFLSVLYDKNK